MMDGIKNLGRRIGSKISSLFSNSGDDIARAGTNNTQNILQGFADEVNQAIPGNGPVVGTKKHSLFKQKVDALGNPNLKTERTFLDGREVNYGTKGGVRVDVIEELANGNFNVYDLKTGSAILTQSRITQIQNAVKPGDS